MQLLASMSLVGAYVALVKPLTAQFPIFALAFLRFAIAAVALLPWTWRSATELPVTRSESRQLFLQSFFGNFLFSICMLGGVARTSATASGLVLGALPVVVALLSSALLAERLTGRLLLATLCAAAGIALVQLAKPSHSVTGSSWLGDALVFGAVCCEADATAQAEYLYDRVAETVRQDLKEELGFVAVFDRALAGVRNIVDMPDRRASLFVRLCLQNGGRLAGGRVQVTFPS